MPHYTNDNGLIDGRIPAGEPCPFFETCGWWSTSCPQPGKVKEKPFSCAFARAHSLVLQNEQKRSAREAPSA